MAKISGFAKAFAGRAAHCRNGHQATLANTAEFFNSLLRKMTTRRSSVAGSRISGARPAT